MHSLYVSTEEIYKPRMYQAGERAAIYLLAAALHGSALLHRAIPSARLDYILSLYCFDKYSGHGQLYNNKLGGLYCLNCNRMYEIPKVGSYLLTCDNCSGMLFNNEEAGLESHWQLYQATSILQWINRLPEKEQQDLWRLLKEFAIRRGDYVSLL